MTTQTRSYRVGVNTCIAAGILLCAAPDPSLAAPPAVNSGPASSVADADAKALHGNRLKYQADPFTGTFNYSVPIEAAPARNNTQPNLTLAYSSSGENSWCGVGWGLEVGYIERYTKDGVPVKWNTGVNPGVPLNEYDGDKGFYFNLLGKQGRLVNVGGYEYRAEVEEDFLRFTLNTTYNRWEVYDKSGNLYYFGKNAGSTPSRMNNPKSGWPADWRGTFRWGLDEVVTATGDQTTITYVTYGSERMIYPSLISYNGHINWNGLSGALPCTHTIQFDTDARPTSDRRISYRSAYRVEHGRRLTSIICKANNQLARRYALTYNPSSSTKRSILQKVEIFGNDNTAKLPTQTFGYSTKPFEFEDTLTDWLDMTVPSTFEKAWEAISGPDYNDASAVVTDLIDIDGDALPDRVRRNRLSPYNNFAFQRNLNVDADGDGRFATADANWTTSSQSSSTDPEWTAINSPLTRFVDLNGDGRPDRVMDYKNYYTSGASYDRYVVERNTGTGFSQETWTGVDIQGTTGNGGLKAVENTGWLKVIDINGDGIPDRVMSLTQPQSSYNYLMVQLGTGSGFQTKRRFGPFVAQGKTSYWGWGCVESDAVKFIDINGDGLPDRVMLQTVDRTAGNTELVQPEARTKFVVEFNNGCGFEEGDWLGVDPQVGWLQKPDGQQEWISGYAVVEGLPSVGLVDLNGDGLPDRVMPKHSDHTKWYVQINNGTAFEPKTEFANVVLQAGSDWHPEYYGILGTVQGLIVSTMIDMNGDGLVDRVVADYNAINNYTPALLQFHVGLNSGKVPDLMTSIDNGIGGSLAIQYTPSTTWDNRKNPADSNSERLLPFVLQTVSSVSASDGVNAARTTTYQYEGGFYDPARREVAGFCVCKVTDPAPSNRSQKYWFHQGGGRDEPANGEFQDSDNFAKRGKPFRIETLGNDGLLYRAVINKVKQDSLGSGRYFPYVFETVTLDYPGGVTTYNASGTRFQYDNTTGNLTKQTDFGQVTLNLATYTIPSGDTSLTDSIPGDTAYRHLAYATIGGNLNIKDHPSSEKLTSDDSGSTIVRETKYTYYSSYGALSTREVRVCSLPVPQYSLESYQYDSFGRRNLTTDATGVQSVITAFETACQMYPTSSRRRVTAGSNNDAVDHITATTYDVRSGLITHATDVMGIKVQNTYDEFFRLTKTEKGTSPNASPSLWVKMVDYHLGVIASGNAASCARLRVNDGVDSVNGIDTWTYVDGFGRVLQTRTEAEQSGQYRVVTVAYDERGESFLTTWPRLESGSGFTKPPASAPATFTDFDQAGRVFKTHPRVVASFNGKGAYTGKSDSPVETDSPLAPTQFDYKNGTDPWWVVVTDPESKVCRYRLDGFGRTNRIEEVDGTSTYATTLNYDLAGELTEIINHNAEHIYYGYNDAGILVDMADPHLGVWRYKRDLAGRLREQTDGKNQRIVFEYSAPLGRLGTKTVYDAASQVVSTATYTYDFSDDGSYRVYKGLLYKVMEGEGWEKNGYDTRGRLQKTTRHLVVNSQDYTTSFGHDDGDRVVSTSYPNSVLTVYYDYHPSGSLKRVYRTGYDFYSTAATAFDEFGHVTQFSYPNGKTTTRTYFPISKRLQQISCSGILTKDYRYSAADDVTYISGTSITYDNLHRVKRYGSFSADYTYDAVGNITQNREPEPASGYPSGSAYTYGNARKQAVKSAYGKTYLYDECGNMIVRRAGATGSQALDYDAENRLTRLSEAGALVVEYGYAANGERLWKRKNRTDLQVWIGNIYEEKDGKTLFHVFAGDQRVCTFEPGSALAVNGGGGASTHVGYYYHQDHLNSSSALSGSAGQQLEVNVWYPFGRTQTATPQAAFQVSGRFTGQTFDAETGLYYYGGRYFDPELGRFIQPDTIIPDLSNPQSYNRYAYALNNPLTYIDPDGHAPAQARPSVRGSITTELLEFLRYQRETPAQRTLRETAQLQFNFAPHSRAPARPPSRTGQAELWGLNVGESVFDPPTQLRPAPARSPNNSLSSRNAPQEQLEFEFGGQARSGGVGNATRLQSSPFYSVVMQIELKPGTFGSSDANHSRQGNRQLHEMLRADPALATRLEALYPGVTAHVAPGPRGGYSDQPPPGLTWHHYSYRPGIMQLIPREHHRAPGAVQGNLHPNQQGGREIWGGRR